MTDHDIEGSIRNALVPAINDLQNSIDWQSKVINHHKQSIEALEEQVAHLTAAVEYAAGRMPQDTTEEPDAHAAPAQDASRYPDDDPVMSDPSRYLDTDDPELVYPGEAAKYLLSNLPEPFDLSCMSIDVEGETLVIDTSREGFEATDEWQEWTSQHFGKGKLGDIEWQDVGDTEEVWVPQAFKLPLAEFDEVFE